MKTGIKAFTLIELLLGIGIFSIIAVTLYGTFVSGIQLSKRSQKSNCLHNEVRWVLERMALDFENMVPYSSMNIEGLTPVFSGNPDQMILVLPSDDGLKVVKYYLRSPDFGSIHRTIIGKHTSRNTRIEVGHKEEYSMKQLVREERLLVDYFQSESNDGMVTDVLSWNIKDEGLNFYYAYSEGGKEDVKIVWKNTWAQDYLPPQVRVELIFIEPESSQDVLKVRRDVFVPIGSLGEEEET